MARGPFDNWMTFHLLPESHNSRIGAPSFIETTFTRQSSRPLVLFSKTNFVIIVLLLLVFFMFSFSVPVFVGLSERNNQIDNR